MLSLNHKATEVVPQNGDSTPHEMDSANPGKTTVFPSAGEGGMDLDNVHFRLLKVLRHL